MIKNKYYSFFGFIVLVLISGQLFAQNNFPDFPPANVTREMDHSQMMFQLGISYPELPPKLEDPNAPKYAFPGDSLNPNGNWTDERRSTITRTGWGLWNNYHDKSVGLYPGADSARLGEYTPIDLLKMHNGEIISTKEEWFEKRRPEIINDLQEHLYGFFPPENLQPKVSFSVKTTKGGKGNLAYIEKQITGNIDTSAYPEVRNKPIISATLRTPANASEPVPVLIIFGGFGNSTERYWNIAAPNGWGVCTFDPNALQPDNGAGLTSYLIGLVNKGNWRKPGDWGTITAWSWGISRLIDHLETDKNVNPNALGLTGHSRYGKATLVTSAFEQRIAIAFPSDAGSLGTKMNRRHWGQDLENSAGSTEYHWMAGNFFKFCGELIPGQYLPRKIENCPVDAHSILALSAPRPVLINGGTQSSWTDPYGMYLTQVAATPVYELLGKKGIIMKDEKPQVDVGYIEGDLAYRFHNGGHTDAPEWPTFFEFASRYIDATRLNVSSDFVTLSAENGSNVTLEIDSNKKWTVKNSANWLTINRNSNSLQIQASENKTGNGRSSELVIEAKGKIIVVAVNQQSKNNKLILSEKELILEGKQVDSIHFSIESNTAWEIISSENWVFFDTEAGVNTKKIIVKAAPNPGVEKRSATLTVSTNNKINQSIHIVQNEGLPTLRISGKIIKLNRSATTNSSIWIMSNTNCEVESEADWISAEITPGRFKRLSVYVQENTTGKVRSTKLKLIVKNIAPQFIEVIQDEK